ncbi:MAG: hypothetical protein ACREFM_08890 [Hypericibacter sp.]
MNADFTLDELHRRLAALDQNLAAAADRIQEGGAATANHQRQVEVLRLKSSLLRQRLIEAKSVPWDDIKASLHADWDGLSENLERWIKDIDKDFQNGRREPSL